MWLRGPGGLATTDEAYVGAPMKHDTLSLPFSLSLSLIWWFVGVRLWILEFGLLVIGSFFILVCWCGARF